MLDAVVISSHAPATALDRVVTPSAVVFLAELARRFRARIVEVRALADSSAITRDEPALPFVPVPEARPARWMCAPPPPALAGRRVELVGPPDARSVLTAVAARATAYVADFDASISPRWPSILAAHRDLRAIIERSARMESELESGLPPILVRPRALHVDEEHVFIDQRSVPAALFDVGLHCFHNGACLAARGQGPFFALSKLNGSAEASLWSDVFDHIEGALGLPPASIKATVQIDTVRALEEVEDILWYLRMRSLGIACGRSEYVRDLIASRGEGACGQPVTPPRQWLTVDRPPLARMAQRLIAVCHARGVHAIGPLTNDASPAEKGSSSRSAFARVYASASRHARLGFDATRVADAAFVGVARAAQAAAVNDARGVRRREGRRHPVDPGEDSVRDNVCIALVHMQASFSGVARVHESAFVEDRATARTARAQLWEWLQRRISLGARILDATRFQKLVREEAQRMRITQQVAIFLVRICLAETLHAFERAEERLRRDLLV